MSRIPNDRTQYKKYLKTHYPINTFTKSGCIIRKHRIEVHENSGNRIILTVKCQKSGRLFEVSSQNAWQVKYHPEVMKRIRQDKKNKQRRDARKER